MQARKCSPSLHSAFVPSPQWLLRSSVRPSKICPILAAGGHTGMPRNEEAGQATSPALPPVPVHTIPRSNLLSVFKAFCRRVIGAALLTSHTRRTNYIPLDHLSPRGPPSLHPPHRRRRRKNRPSTRLLTATARLRLLSLFFRPVFSLSFTPPVQYLFQSVRCVIPSLTTFDAANLFPFSSALSAIPATSLR